MASSTPLCSTCDYRHISKPATVWCSECDEGFCSDCSDHHSSAKSTRRHKTTPIQDYQKLPQYITDIEQFCREHNEKFTLFCKGHDTPCCRNCLQNHKQCQGIVKIEEVVQNVKTSHTFQETEQILTELNENIQKIQKDQEDNLVSLKKSKIQVEKEIKEFRVKINDHLDKMQNNIMKELHEADEMERKKIQKIIDELEKKEKELNKTEVNLSNIKLYASDLQAYLAMKTIQSDLGKTDALVDSIVNSDSLQQKVLLLEINAAMNDILSKVDSFGQITVETKVCNVVTRKKKNKQAQLFVPLQPRNIDDITLQLQQTLNVNNDCITGCCTLPDGSLVLTSNWNNKLIFMNTNGTQNTTLTIPSHAFDVTCVKYNNTLALTSYDSDNPCITFINIKNNNVQETVKLKSECFGIAVKNDRLFFCQTDSIMSLKLPEKSVTKLIDFNQGDCSYIDIYENNLYHTNRSTNTITCYDLSGEVKWEFKDENIIKRPAGISVDNRGNVYVACTATSNVVVISPDGQKSREILSSKDNLENPWAIHYDRSTDNLLVANYSDTAFLYKVT